MGLICNAKGASSAAPCYASGERVHWKLCSSSSVLASPASRATELFLARLLAKGLVRLEFEARVQNLNPKIIRLQESRKVLAPYLDQLNEYFAGQRREFSIPLDLRGTDFQLKCWRALLDIPYGETRSYRDLAQAIGHPNAFRAVGMSNNRNPIAIVVPCHRVIASRRLALRLRRRTRHQAQVARPRMRATARQRRPIFLYSGKNRSIIALIPRVWAHAAAFRVFGYGPGVGRRGLSRLPGPQSPASSRNLRRSLLESKAGPGSSAAACATSWSSQSRLPFPPS